MLLKEVGTKQGAIYMEISINSGCLEFLQDDKKVVALLKRAGFTAYDHSLTFSSLQMESWIRAENYLERAKEFREYIDGLGIYCNQTHAPLRPATKGATDYNKEMLKLVLRSIEISGVLGAKICVVHPCTEYTEMENATFYRSMETVARKANVKIALENVWDWKGGFVPVACSRPDDFKSTLDLLPEDVFVACLDIGHAEMKALGTSSVELIETLGKRLQCIHLHDNDCVRDSHLSPYKGKIDFVPIIEALKKNGYQGDVTLEITAEVFKSMPQELYESELTAMANVANYFKIQLKEG